MKTLFLSVPTFLRYASNVMIDLLRFTNDVFDDMALSDPKLRTFADDHLNRLTQLNTDGTFDPLIAATSTAYSAYYGKMTSESSVEALGQGRTIGTRQAWAAVLGKLTKQRHLLAYTFGRKSDIYQQFFPNGMVGYRRAPLDTLPALLKRYVTAAQAHLPPTEASEVQALVTTYVNARKAQRTTTAETDKQRTARRANRKALTLQLTANVLIIASRFLDRPDAFDNFFDLKLLPKKRKPRKVADQ